MTLIRLPDLDTSQHSGTVSFSQRTMQSTQRSVVVSRSPVEPRVKVNTYVQQCEGEQHAWTALDLSRGGLFVAGFPLLAPGTTHCLAISLPANNGSVLLPCRARVAWTNGPAGRQKPSLPVGMGLEFVGLELDSHRVLDAYLRHRSAQQELAIKQLVAQFVDEMRALEAPTDKTQKPLPTRPPPQVPDFDCDDSIDAEDLVIDVQFVNQDVPFTNQDVPFTNQDVPFANQEASSCELATSPERPTAPCFGDDNLAAGTRIGEYSVVDKLGAGSMGDIYVAEHVKTGRRVAIKRLSRRYHGSKDIVRRFEYEADKLRQLRHANVVEVESYLEAGADKCFVMELLCGHTLASVVRPATLLEIEQVIDVGIQLCDALEAVHQAGIVHRDLKPDNVFLVEHGEAKPLVKLLDFGVAKFVDVDTGVSPLQTMVGAVLGTPGYLAPEQILGLDVDARCDIYAFGVVLFQLLTGAMPFVGDSWQQLMFRHLHEAPKSLSALRPEIDSDWEKLVLNCLAKQPAQRPESAARVKAELERIKGALERTSRREQLRATGTRTNGRGWRHNMAHHLRELLGLENVGSSPSANEQQKGRHKIFRWPPASVL